MSAMRTRVVEIFKTPLATISGVLVVGFVLVAVASSMLNRPDPHRYISVDASYPSFTLVDIARRSDAVAILEFGGTTRAFWNSSDNKEWAPETASGKQAWIYRDDGFRVLKVLRGSLPTPTLTVRGVGGTVGDVTVTLEGQVDWVTDLPYLMFLRQDNTPFREGFERAWTVVWTGHGALESLGGGRWSNAVGTLSLTEADLAALE